MGCVECASLRNDLDEPIGKAVDATAARTLGQRAAEHLHNVFQQAVAAAREAVRLKPDFVLARDVLSRLYRQSGEVESAIEQCRLALRDDPSDEVALYRLIRSLQASGRPDRAAEVPALLKRFTALREELRKRQTQETQYRLVEDNSAGHRSRPPTV